MVFTYFAKGNESPAGKLNVIAKMEDGIRKHDMGQYLIDLFERKIIDKGTDNVLYNDSAVMYYPEKEITLNNFGIKTMELLKKLKMIDSDETYYMTDTTISDGHYSLNSREGYFATP